MPFERGVVREQELPVHDGPKVGPFVGLSALERSARRKPRRGQTAKNEIASLQGRAESGERRQLVKWAVA